MLSDPDKRRKYDQTHSALEYPSPQQPYRVAQKLYNEALGRGLLNYRGD